MFHQKKILLCVTGSIAAYKTPQLVRLLVKAGAEVQVLATEAALAFATPLSLATVSKRPVYSQYFEAKTGAWHNHVELALWADLLLIAPASANTLGKMANGICDNLVLAAYFSAKCPVFFAPAMDLDMYQHPATKKNIATLQEYGNLLIPAEVGELASGLSGEGRMAEPEHIVAAVAQFFEKKQPLKGINVMVSAGATHEAIDPVRFIGNHSSGKMGIEIALALANAGANVQLVAGITQLKPQHPNIVRTDVRSAAEMYAACTQIFPQCSVGVMCAAVADYAPTVAHDQKIKKSEPSLTIELTKTKDILKALGVQKTENQLLVGFALETENGIANAQKKLIEKNLDAIVLNTMQDAGAGFAHDTNKITILDKYTKPQTFELKTKSAVAQDILHKILTLLNK